MVIIPFFGGNSHIQTLYNITLVYKNPSLEIMTKYKPHHNTIIVVTTTAVVGVLVVTVLVTALPSSAIVYVRLTIYFLCCFLKICRATESVFVYF